MSEAKYPEEVICPLVNSMIDSGVCILVVDCADGLIKETLIEPRFTNNKNWKGTCKKCENRKYQD